MPEALIRPFRRADRDQLTRLVNAHAAAVLPGPSASGNTVMGQLEREPGESILDPWVADRSVLVAEQARSVVAVALLHRYGDGDDVGATYRGTGEVRWSVFWPSAPEDDPHWHDGRAAATALMGSCPQQVRR